MQFRDSSIETIAKFLIKVIGRSQHLEILKPQFDGNSVSFSARACWEPQKRDLARGGVFSSKSDLFDMQYRTFL